MNQSAHPPAQSEAVAPVLGTGDGRWVLAGPLTISNVAGVLAASVGVPLPQTGRIDLKNVDPVDSAGVALLLEWKRRAVAEQKSLTFENVTPSMASLAELYGVAEMLTSA